MKSFIILVFLPIFASSIYVDPKCRAGESYWCSSLANAKVCHAFDHCKTTVWQNQMLQTDNAEVCQFCKAIVGDVSQYLRDNQTQAFISSFLQSVCDIVPNINMVSECKKLIEGYLPEILEIISLDLDKQAICSLLGMCNQGLAFKDNVMHPEPSLPSLLPADKTLCDDCIKFNTDLKEKLFGKEAQAKMVDFVDAYLCPLCPFKQKCISYVQNQLPKILQKIYDQYNPNKCCKFICQGDISPASKQFADFFNLYQKLDSKTDECTACMLVMGAVQSLDQNKDFQNQITGTMKNFICPMLKNYTKQCDNMVDMYLPIIFQFLASELDPSARCRNFGFCPSQDVNRIPMIELQPAVSAPHRHMADHVKATPQCILCEFVMNQLQKLIGDNATEDNIIAALDKVCSILPSTVKDECVSFIELYGKAILNLLLNNMNPEEICSTIGLCSIKSNKLVFKPQGLTSTCEICEITMQYLESLLDEKSSLDEIKTLLDKICNFLPENYKQQCDKIISDYEGQIIDFLIKKMPPKVICQEIKLCPASGTDVAIEDNSFQGTTTTAHKVLFYKCTYGPSFWCASEQNAAICQAEDHCKKFVW